jgi:hypothetical protein
MEVVSATSSATASVLGEIMDRTVMEEEEGRLFQSGAFQLMS